jgi:hypothetical protein
LDINQTNTKIKIRLKAKSPRDGKIKLLANKLGLKIGSLKVSDGNLK